MAGEDAELTAKLFDPIAIRGLELPNRIVMPPMTTRLAAPDGAVTAALIAYYAARARGGAGLVIVEMGSPAPAGRHRGGELGLSDDRFLPGLRTLVAAIHADGARAAVQIGHAGGHTRADVTGEPPVAPSAIPHAVQEVDTRTVIPRALDEAGIAAVIEAFGATVTRVRAAGFDAAEIHGAHGYLLAQFLSPLDNRRDDRWGGSLENRARLALEVLRAARARAGDFPLIFRYSADEFAPGGFTPDEAVRLAPWLVEAGADALHVSAGCYRSLPSGAVMNPPMRLPQGVFLEYARAVRASVRVPVIAVGRLHDPAIAARAVADGAADLVAVGRQLIADPEWPKKIRAGRTETIRPCIACNTCIDGMREGGPLGCLVNPFAAREGELVAAPAARLLRVVVVGGGPAGMEAAQLLARRGHRVTLYERRQRFGGALALAVKAPLFQNVEPDAAVIEGWIARQALALMHAGVDVRLGREASVASLVALAPDAVVLAAGAVYRGPLRALVPLALLWRRARGRKATALLRRAWVKRLVYRTLRRPDQRLEAGLRRAGLAVHRIGDCAVPGRTPEAMRSAAELACRL